MKSFNAVHGSWEQQVKEHDVELEKELRALPDMAGKSGQELGAAYQRLQEDIEGIKPLKTKLPSHQGQLDDLRQERRNRLAELSDLLGRAYRCFDPGRESHDSKSKGQAEN